MRIFRHPSALPEESSSNEHFERIGDYQVQPLNRNTSHTMDISSSRSISPRASIANSMALSDGETLQNDGNAQLELQERYTDNYGLYLPFLLRRYRYENEDRIGHGPIPNMTDNETMVDDSEQTDFILGKDISRFNVKRELIIAGEILKQNTYLFISKESFKTFKQLRSTAKKRRKSLVVIYDSDGHAKVVSPGAQGKVEMANPNAVVDDRPHIIPVEMKHEGMGLPLFKIQAPNFSLIRKNTPFIIFSRYREYPLPPNNQEIDKGEYPKSHETYQFCSVHVKHFYKVRRFTCSFTPAGSEPFKVLVFQHNYLSFADFNYRGTRFRVLGTSLSNMYVRHYNPSLKLVIVDRNKPSLCDELVNKKKGFEMSSLIKGKKKTEKKKLCEEPEDGMSNPYPSEACPFLRNMLSSSVSNEYLLVPRLLPPFGALSDALFYNDSFKSLLPKRYPEVGKIELYQDDLTIPPNTDINSTFSTDLDTLVLCAIMLTLRESNIRIAARSNSTHSFMLASISAPAI